MSKILLIVEGNQEERDFFERYNETRKSSTFSVVSFNKNIFSLYKICEEYIFDGIKPNNIVDVLKDNLNNPTVEDLEKLNDKYTDIFLIFDLDLQNHRKPFQTCDEYLNKVFELIDFFNDSTTIGQLLINYPMMESFMHIDDDNFNCFKDFSISSKVAEEGKYKQYLHKMNINYSVDIMKEQDFTILAAYNLKKTNYIVNGTYEVPTKEIYEYDLTQRNIFDKQVENLKNGFLYTLNTSIFVDVDLNGKKLYFNERYKFIYEERNNYLNGYYKKINKFKE